MFDGLQKRLGSVFDRLRGRGALSEADVDAALAEVRMALIDADVALPVVKDFIAKVREQAIGEAVIRSVTPGQQVVKIVHDALVEMLGAEGEGALARRAAGAHPDGRPAGLGQDHHLGQARAVLQNRDKKRVLMASLDVNRPAAMEQLKVLGEQAGVADAAHHRRPARRRHRQARHRGGARRRLRRGHPRHRRPPACR